MQRGPLAGRRRAGAVVAAVALVLAGCVPAGEEAVEAEPAEATPTPTPTPTPTQTPTPTPTPDDEVPDAAGELEVHFFDVGQGDATLLRTDEVGLLIDTGRHDRDDVVPHLEAADVGELDLVAVTHPHADHLGQFDRVIEAVEVAEVWWSGAVHTTQTFERALDALEASDASYGEPRAGDVTDLDGLEIEVVNPPEDADFDDLHDSNLALRVTWGEVRFLFTGDAEEPTEQRMVARHGDALAADIYQVGHHGSSTSTSAGFLDAVAPAVAIYSAGEGNQYEHPHDEVVERLHAAGVKVYGTDVHGTLVVTTDGEAYTVEPAHDAPPVTP